MTKEPLTLSQIIKNAALLSFALFFTVSSLAVWKVQSFVSALTREVQQEEKPVELEQDYFVVVTRLEANKGFFNKKNKLEFWDDEDDLPDLFYTLKWHGRSAWESDVRKDTLTARWQAVSKKAYSLSLSIDSFINAPLLTAKDKGWVEVAVFDHDKTTKDDLIDRYNFELLDLSVGVNKIDCSKLANLEKLEVLVLPYDDTYIGNFIKKMFLNN